LLAESHVNRWRFGGMVRRRGRIKLGQCGEETGRCPRNCINMEQEAYPFRSSHHYMLWSGSAATRWA
jgi:hypothetical protein